MLDVFIIEEIKRREREMERRQDEGRPRQQLPVPEPLPKRRDDNDVPSDRGVVIIDYSIDDYGRIDGYAAID